MNFPGLGKALTMGAVLGALLAGGAARAEWLEARSAHFRVLGDLSEKDLRERTIKLERFDGFMRGLLKVPDNSSTATIYVVRGEEIRKLAGNSMVLGFYEPSYQGARGFIPVNLNNTPGITPNQVMFHEYTHHIQLSNETAVYPAWATEGLAELFSTTVFDTEGNATIGRPVLIRQYSIGAQHAWSVSRLLEADVKPPQDEEVEELYTRGWALSHYLLISGKRPGQYFQYIGLRNKGVPPLEAGEKAFGKLDRLDSEVESYLRQPSFPSSTIKASSYKASLDVSVRKLSAGEVAMMPYRLVSARGVTGDAAGPLAAEAAPVAARYPDDAIVQREMAEINYDARAYDAADINAQKALALAPDDMMAMVYRGRVAARRALVSHKAEDWATARGWFLKANHVAPNDALPFVLYYDSFGAAGEAVPQAAANGLYRAVVLMPADHSLRVRAAVALIREGDKATARSLLAPLALDPHNLKNPIGKMVKAIDDGADKDALLDKVKELRLNFNEFAAAPKGNKAQ